MTESYLTPAAGGSYIRDDKTGALTPAPAPEPAAPVPPPVQPANETPLKGASK